MSKPTKRNNEMKKMILILALAVPALCFGQKENVKLGEQKQKGQTEDTYDQQKERKMRQIEQQERQREMMKEMRSAMAGPESYVYAELLIVSNGKEEEVRFNIARSVLEQIKDPVSVREIESLASRTFDSLAEALSVLDQIGFSYLDSYSIGMKEPILKVILRMPLPEEESKSRR